MSTRGLYVLVKVLSVNRNFAFPCCIRCSTRIRTEDDENVFLCSKCQQKYDKKHITYRYRVNMTVSDRTQVSNVTVFGQCLEEFFGTSATQLKRFVEDMYLEKEELPLPVDQVVHQCIEQCFVGSIIRLCFRGLHPCQTDSQASRSSPTHLKNILTKMQEAKMNYLPKQQQNTSHLLASYMSRPENIEKNATVFELLKEYLEFFRYSKSMTPSCCTNGPNQISSSGPKCNPSLPLSNSRLHMSFGRKSFEEFSCMVSPLILSCEARRSSQTPAAIELPIQTDSELKRETRMENTSIFDNSLNRTALMLASLLDTNDEFMVDSSSDHISDTADFTHDRSTEYFKCLNNLTYFTEDIVHDKRDNEIEAEDIHYQSHPITGKPSSIDGGILIENEQQESQHTCAWNDDDQKDMEDLFLDEDLNSFFANLSLDSYLERNKASPGNSQYAKGEKSSIEDQYCHRLEDAREIQDHLVTKCNSFQEDTDQISVSFPEDVLADLEFSNFSFMFECDNVREPRPCRSKTSPAVLHGHKSQNKEHSKESLEDFMQNPSEVNSDNHFPLPAGIESRKDYYRTSLCYTSPDKCPCFDKSSVEYTSESVVSTPARLSWQSIFEQTSTPVLFDDSRDSTDNRLELYRSLSIPEAPQPESMMRRRTSLNIHSTPLNSQCERKFKDLSGDLQNYSGLFVDEVKKHSVIGQTVSLDAKAAHNQGGISKDFPIPTTRKCLGNSECIDEFSSACSHRQMKEDLDREEDGEENVVGLESFSVGTEMPSDEARQDWWNNESPLLFSFSSTENSSCKMTSDIQQDSLLCASLLECSYLK